MLVCEFTKRHTVDMGLIDIVICRYDYNDEEKTYVELLFSIPKLGYIECTVRHGVGRKPYYESRFSIEQSSIQSTIQDLFVEAESRQLKSLYKELEAKSVLSRNI